MPIDFNFVFKISSLNRILQYLMQRSSHRMYFYQQSRSKLYFFTKAPLHKNHSSHSPDSDVDFVSTPLCIIKILQTLGRCEIYTVHIYIVYNIRKVVHQVVVGSSTHLSNPTHPTVTSKMLDPTDDDTAMSPNPFLATMTLVIRSGMEVPAARKVRPIT